MDIKILYAEDESGWAVDLGGGRARIANLPLSDDLNIDDVVSLKAGPGGRLRVDKVLSRVFEKKTALDYGAPHQETYAKIWPAFVKVGMKVEGIENGLCLVAHRSDEDPRVVCAAAGVEVWLRKIQPKLASLSVS